MRLLSTLIWKPYIWTRGKQKTSVANLLSEPKYSWILLYDKYKSNPIIITPTVFPLRTQHILCYIVYFHSYKKSVTTSKKVVYFILFETHCAYWTNNPRGKMKKAFINTTPHDQIGSRETSNIFSSQIWCILLEFIFQLRELYTVPSFTGGSNYRL